MEIIDVGHSIFIHIIFTNKMRHSNNKMPVTSCQLPVNGSIDGDQHQPLLTTVELTISIYISTCRMKWIVYILTPNYDFHRNPKSFGTFSYVFLFEIPFICSSYDSHQFDRFTFIVSSPYVCDGNVANRIL